MRDPLGQLKLRFAGLQPVHTGTRAEVHTGKDFAGRAVTVVVLAESAASDQGLREAYCRAASAVEPAQAALDPYAERPWAAFYDDPQTAVAAIFAALGEPAPKWPAAPEGPASPVVAEEPGLTAEPEPSRPLEKPAGPEPSGQPEPPESEQPHPPVPPPPRTPPPGPSSGAFPHPPVPPPPPMPPPAQPSVVYPAPSSPYPSGPPPPPRPGSGLPAELTLPPKMVGPIIVGAVLLAVLVCACCSRLV